MNIISNNLTRGLVVLALLMVASACGDLSGWTVSEGGSPDVVTEQLQLDSASAASEDTSASDVPTIEMVHPITGEPITDAEINDALDGQSVDLSDADVSPAMRLELERATGLMMIAMGGCMQTGDTDCIPLKTTQAQLERLVEASRS